MLNSNKALKKIIALAAALAIFTGSGTSVFAADDEVYEDLIVKEILEEQRSAEQEEVYEDLIVKEILAEQQANKESEKSENDVVELDVALEEAEGGRVIFLLYHDIAHGDTLKETDDPLWCTTEEKLKRDIAAFKELGFESLNCRRYYAGDYDKSKDYFVVTFDDGYISNYEILPSLTAETETYADIFMCTEMALRGNHFGYGDARKMDESEYIDIYSHFNTHEYVDKLSKDELRRKLKLSFYYLERRLTGEHDMFFAYPHSSYSEETVRLLKEFGVGLQFVQTLPNSFDGYDWNESGMVLRINVAYESDIEQIVTEYFEMSKALPKVGATDLEVEESEESEEAETVDESTEVAGSDGKDETEA